MKSDRVIDSDYGRRWFKGVTLVILFLLGGELICRGWDAYDAWAKYNHLLFKTVTYREQVFSISKPKDVFRIILLGGSAVYDPIENYKDSWPYLMQEKLTEKLQQKVEVINMAYFSEASTDELFKLNEFGLSLKPDLVVVFDGNNDVYNLWMHHEPGMKLFNEKVKHILSPKKKHSFFTELRGKLKKESSLYQRLNRGSKWIQKKLSLLALKLKKQTLTHQKNETAEVKESFKETTSLNDQKQNPTKISAKNIFEDVTRWDQIEKDYLMLYEHNLEKIAKLLQLHRIEGLFIFQPDLSYKQQASQDLSEAEKTQYLRVIQNHDELWQKIITKAYPQGLEIMRKVSKKYDIKMRDFNQELFVDRPADYADFFEGNVHFSVKGRQVIAELIADLIHS